MIEILKIIQNVLIYILIVLPVALLIHYLKLCDKTVFRKILHLIALGLVLVIISGSDEYEYPLFCLLVLTVIIYVILVFLERYSWFSDLLKEKSKGEIKKSLLELFLSESFNVLLFWGIFKKQYIVYTALFVWSLGDMMAALIGTRYGKHKISLPFADHNKTIEGSLSMLLTDIVVAFIFLNIFLSSSFTVCLIESILVAAVATIAELMSHNGHDTSTVVIAVAIVLLLFSFI